MGLGVYETLTSPHPHCDGMPKFLISEPPDAILASLAEALDLVDFGIVLLNRDMRARFVNRRFAEMWAGPPQLLVTGPGFRALLENTAANRLFDVPASEVPGYLDKRIAAVRAGAVPPTQVDLRDGRRLLFRCTPSADGGRILTWADITPVKEEQAQYREARDAAERMNAEQRFNAETLESQAAYLASLAETADESARRAEAANRQLEHEIAERRQLEAQLRRMATTDGLTGTLNRARFLVLGQQELERSQQTGRGLAVLMLDIDHFKLINDRYGHLAGDEALKHFVAQLDTGVRGVDLLGRLGGEEFAIVLPAIGSKAALQAAERLRARVAATPLIQGDYTIGITVSIGLATAKETDRTIEQILGRADARLYAAKHGGRNRVVFSERQMNAQAGAYAGSGDCRDPAGQLGACRPHHAEPADPHADHARPGASRRARPRRHAT
jgi:diguanylate cyclase (GGDEF)-like protein